MNLSLAIILSSSALGFIANSSQAALGPIMITPTRTLEVDNKSSATVYLLGRDEIEKSGAITTSELLRGIPGVQVDDLFGNGTEVTISVRGFSATANANTLILVNGRRLNHSDTAAPDIHHIFPKDIERVEVLVGSAGTLYGDQAVGGVINIITRKAEVERLQISSRVGSFGYNGIEFNASSPVNDTLSYRVSAERFQADHYRDNNSESNSNVSGLLDFSFDESSLIVELQRIEDKLELPGALIESEYNQDPTQSNAGFAEDFLNEDTTAAAIGYQFKAGEQMVSLDFSQAKTDAEVRQSFRNSPSTMDGFIKRENISFNPKVSGNIDIGVEADYVAGIDLQQIEYDLKIPFFFFGPGETTNSNDQETQSLYFQLNPAISETMRATVGLRHSTVENNMKDGNSFPAGIRVEDDITVYELGLAYQLNEDLKLTARYDENFRFAKVNELAQAAPGKILETQTGESYELGMELTEGDQRWVVSLYQLDLENEIVFDPTVGTFGENINLDKTRRSGLTLSWQSQIAQWLGLKTELGYVDARFASGTFDGNDISGVAANIVKIRGDFRLDDRLSSFLEGHYTGSRYAQGDNGNDFAKLNSIAVLNAGLAYQHMQWNFHFRINNLADKKYAQFVTNNGFGTAYQPSPERNFMLGAGYRFE